MIERQPLTLPDRLNHTWSMDFVMDALAHGRRIKCLTIVDDFTNECLDIPVAHEISGDQVVRTLDGIAAFRSYPKAVSARSTKPGCVFGHSRQVSSMLQVQGATGNQGCLCSGAEKTEVPLAHAFAGGVRTLHRPCRSVDGVFLGPSGQHTTPPGGQGRPEERHASGGGHGADGGYG